MSPGYTRQPSVKQQEMHPTSLQQSVQQYELTLTPVRKTPLKDVVSRLRLSSQERLLIIGYNSRDVVSGYVEVAVGTSNGIAFNARDVIAAVLQLNAVSFVLMHNHPSGDPTPSDADKKFTDKMQRVCRDLNLTLKFHMVVTPDGDSRSI